jgi:hypothetical protein
MSNIMPSGIDALVDLLDSACKKQSNRTCFPVDAFELVGCKQTDTKRDTKTVVKQPVVKVHCTSVI